MGVYVFILVLLILSSIFCDFHKSQNNQKKILYIFTSLLLVVTAVLSYRMGIDTQRYMRYFNQSFTLANFEFAYWDVYRFEPGWTVLMVLVKTIFGDFFFLKLIAVLPINILICIFFYRYSKAPFLCQLLYFISFFFGVSFEILRQDVAMSFVLWGCFSLFSDNRKGFLIRAWPCVIFHKTGILILIAIYLFSFINVKRWMLLIPLLIFIMGQLIAKYMADIVSIVNIFSEDNANLMKAYQSNENYGNVITSYSLSRLFYNIFKYIAMPLIVTNWLIKERNNNIFCGICFLYLIISALQPILYILTRLAIYLLPIFTIAASNFIFKYLKIKTNKPLYLTMAVVYLSFSFYSVKQYTSSEEFGYPTGGYDVRYFPYTSIFDENNPVYIKRLNLIS